MEKKDLENKTEYIGDVIEGSVNKIVFLMAGKYSEAKKVKAFCGCTSYTRKKNSKGEFLLSVTFRAKKVPKHLPELPFSRKLNVYYNNGTFEDVFIKGTIKKKI